MNILDENIIGSQRQALCDRRIAVRQIGVDLGHKGMSDDEAAAYVAFTLRHPGLKTWAKRAGTVVQAATHGIRLWRLHGEDAVELSW
jgi:hypothetical protein